MRDARFKYDVGLLYCLPAKPFVFKSMTVLLERWVACMRETVPDCKRTPKAVVPVELFVYLPKSSGAVIRTGPKHDACCSDSCRAGHSIVPC